MCQARRPPGRGRPPRTCGRAGAGRLPRAARPPQRVPRPAGPAAATISAAITASAAVPLPAPTTRAGTPTTRTAMTATAKLENHSLLRIGHPAARPADRAAPAASVAAFKAEPDAADRGDVPGAVRVVAELAA